MYIVCLVLINLLCIEAEVNAQLRTKKYSYIQKIDSISNRIAFLQKQMPKLKESRSLSFYNLKRELDQTLFLKTYTEYLYNEELDKARALTEKNLEHAEFRRDENSMGFYSDYKKSIYYEIKLQKMRYQALFVREKNFRKAILPFLKEKSPESLERAKRTTLLAMKYATENQFTETLKYLKKYDIYIDALIYDLNSPYDLHVMTRSEKAFDKAFLDLANSDSLNDLKAAAELIDQGICYCAYVHCPVDTSFFIRKKKYAANAVTDYYERKGGKVDLETLTDQAIVAKLDSLNPPGVYKWHGKIVVINEIVPKYSSPNLKKGEAILASDRKLIRYIKDQEVFKVSNNIRIQGTFFIPYKNENKSEEFMYNFKTHKWQYMICYNTIENSTMTKEVSKYMPPILFSEENPNE